jgi:diguanylate cyclase (GGDEF)-like protein
LERPPQLVVGDEGAAAALRDAGFRVIQVADGAEALARIAEDRPDLVVLDVFLPRLGGPDVCQKIKRGRGFIPILLLTPRQDPAARVDCLRAGADDVLSKPCDVDELRARVEALLRRRRLDDAPAGRQAAPTDLADDERDRLTGLANQRHFTRRLEEELANASGASEPLSVMAIDLDGFGEIVSRFGRSAGDRLLVAVARALLRACRAQDVVARAGGDEFVVILPGIHFFGAAGVAERVWREIRQTAVLEAGTRVACEASIGAASYPTKDIDTSSDLLRYAHAALARAKSEGRGRVCLYQQHGYLVQPEP